MTTLSSPGWNAPLRSIRNIWASATDYSDPRTHVSCLDWSFRASKNFDRLRRRTWSRADTTHYAFLVSVILFVAIIHPAPALLKLFILTLFSLAFILPVTLQFFVNALPIFAWLALYFSAGKIPNTWKPPISVKALPAMETILYGDDLSNVLAATTNKFLDIVAWFPYGIVHFSAPFITAALIFIFGPPTLLRLFGFSFGYMNLFGVMIQLAFPAASPWYKNLYGLEPANYGMHGSPGGLGRIDALFGVDMYTTAFSTLPVIFGAFPSLHAGCAVMDVLWLSYVFPRARLVWWGYALWLWWSTMYLTHHYFIDLIGGAVLLFLVFQYTRYNHLPVADPTKLCRWVYTLVSTANISAKDPLSLNYLMGLEEYHALGQQTSMGLAPFPVIAPRSGALASRDIELGPLPLLEEESSDTSANEAERGPFEAPMHASSATSQTSVDETDLMVPDRSKKFRSV